MDSEQTFMRVQDRFSQILTPKVRAALEYMFFFTSITLFSILLVMHANYVQQPGCSSELSGFVKAGAQMMQIKITSAGLWSQNESESNRIDVPDPKTVTDKTVVSDVNGDESTFLTLKFWLNWIGSSARSGKLVFKFWKTDTEILECQAETSTGGQNYMAMVKDAVIKIEKEELQNSFTLSAKETLKAAVTHTVKKWYPKWSHILHLDKLNSNAVEWLENKAFEPAYLYTMEKGYFLLPETAKSHHNIRAINISISAWHSCFGNRWQQLLINRFVGYDTILINSLLSSLGQGYLYNYQTKEFYNLSYAQAPPAGPDRFGDYLVTKCGILMMSLFVFFTITMSVSFTLRETQTRMLRFTVQLQHHAQHRLPTFQLIFVYVIESLIFVPIMIGVLFFLFEFYHDQLLAFMVLVLVWVCELFTLISVRTPISMKFFPRFFLLYFLVFHIYFLAYGYGFSYLALYTTAAFTQHLILYFWNRFEVPAMQRFIQNWRSQDTDFHITSSTILTSTLHIRRLNTGNQGLTNTNLNNGSGVINPQVQPENNPVNRVANHVQVPGQAGLQQAERGPNPGSMNSANSLLLWILGGASSEGLNSFFSIFRDVRDQGQVFAEPPNPGHDNGESQNGRSRET